MSLHLTRVALSLVVTLPEHIFDRHLPCSPHVVGDELMSQVIDYAQRERLGYYPPLDYFQQQGGIDQDLLDAAENVSWFASNVARDEIRRKLRPVFSSVTFQYMQTVAFTMPTVRPGQPNVHLELARHFTPDTIKVGLVVSSFQRTENDESMTKWARHLVYRWLKGSFDSLQVNSAEVI